MVSFAVFGSSQLIDQGGDDDDDDDDNADDNHDREIIKCVNSYKIDDNPFMMD